jgi:hypothetical protein
MMKNRATYENFCHVYVLMVKLSHKRRETQQQQQLN